MPAKKKVAIAIGDPFGDFEEKAVKVKVVEKKAPPKPKEKKPVGSQVDIKGLKIVTHPSGIQDIVTSDGQLLMTTNLGIDSSLSGVALWLRTALLNWKIVTNPGGQYSLLVPTKKWGKK